MGRKPANNPSRKGKGGKGGGDKPPPNNTSNSSETRSTVPDGSVQDKGTQGLKETENEDIDQRNVEISSKELQDDSQQRDGASQEINQQVAGAEGTETKPRGGSRSRSKSPLRTDRSRSVSPDGVDHRPKPSIKHKKRVYHTESESEDDYQLASNVSRGAKRVRTGGAAFEPSDSELSLEVNSSEDDFSDNSSRKSLTPSESSSSEDEDDKAYKRRRKRSATPRGQTWGRSRERKSSRSGSKHNKKKRRRTRSRSVPTKGRKDRRGKRHKRDVDQIVTEALNKQRVEMEKYFERLTQGRDPR